jgi:AraC-like DNA-binding protein
MTDFASICGGRERRAGRTAIARHRHDRAYAAIVVAGGYEEAGSRGRFVVAAGDVLAHRAYDAHLDRICAKGAEIVNLVLTHADLSLAHGRVSDPDAIASAAERDPRHAEELLAEQLIPAPQSGKDWPDRLACALLHDPELRLGSWAYDHGLAPETLSRGFRQRFGVTPAGFRAEARTRLALERLALGERLSAAAAGAGFADQAHMTRAVRTLTGLTPGALAKSNSFKTKSPPPP